MLISGFQSHSSLGKLHRHDVLEYTTYIKHDLLQFKVQYKTSQVGSTSDPMKKRCLQVTTVCCHYFSYVFMKKTSDYIISSYWQKASHVRLLQIVTWPSMWPPGGLNLPSCLKMKSYLCHFSKSGIYTTFYLRAIHIVKKHNVVTYFGLLSFKVTYLQN